MKKFNLQNVGLFFISLVMFSSCLDEGRNIQGGTAFGVVRYDYATGLTLLDVADASFYSVRFQDTADGACYFVQYELDYSKPENASDRVLASGYYSATILAREEVDRWGMSYFFTDTSMVLTDEIAIIEPTWDGECDYVKGMFFILSTLKMPSDQRMKWNMSFDSENMVTEERGLRFYDVYLRATIQHQGVRSPEETVVANAFNMGYYLDMAAKQEKGLGNNSFMLRFHYVSEIKDEQITWSTQNSVEVPVDVVLID